MKIQLHCLVTAVGMLTLHTVVVAESASAPSIAPESQPKQSLTVFIDDDKGVFYPETEWTRENLLQSALHQASRHESSIQIKELRYNETVPDAATDTLALRIHSWRRSHSGFYEFRAFAHYYDGAGTQHSLGTLTGTQSSLKVFTRFDVRDAFEEVVEMAFRQAFRKIERFTSNPT